MKKNAVIFDLDGTLLNSLDDLADAGNTTLREHGFPTHPVDAYRQFVGNGMIALIRRMLPEGSNDDKTVTRFGNLYREKYAQQWNVKTKVYAGVHELLDQLAAKEVKMAILSNKPDHFTQQCVDGFFPQGTFDIVVGQREGQPCKPDPSGARQIAAQWQLPPEQIVYVGDTATDMQTATTAGMYAVGVPWGFRDEEELRANGAERIIEHPTDMLDLFG